MKRVEMGKVLKNTQIAEGIFDMELYVPKIAIEAKAGQFINMYTGRGEYLLPRPISICRAESRRGVIRVVYQVVGKGTEIFSKAAKGEYIKIAGPLGNGFEFDKNPEKPEDYIIIGGGIGAPPLLQLTASLKGRRMVYLGAKTDVILEEDFRAVGGEVRVATDNGSRGYHGTVMDVVKRFSPKGKQIFACGPRPMLKAVAEWAAKMGIPAQVSMEERMACGFGVCVGCAIKIKRPEEQDWQYLKVCKDGPVFRAEEVVWND